METSLTLSNAAVLSLMTNLSRLADCFGLDLQVDNLKLDLNGFALIGFNNVLTNLTSLQLVTRDESPEGRGQKSGTPSSAVSAVRHNPPVSITPGALSNASAVLDGLSLCLATNVAAETHAKTFRVHVGNLMLRLNGFAVIGATNVLEGLTTQQELPTTLLEASQPLPGVVSPAAKKK